MVDQSSRSRSSRGLRLRARRPRRRCRCGSSAVASADWSPSGVRVLRPVERVEPGGEARLLEVDRRVVGGAEEAAGGLGEGDQSVAAVRGGHADRARWPAWSPMQRQLMAPSHASASSRPPGRLHDDDGGRSAQHLRRGAEHLAVDPGEGCGRRRPSPPTGRRRARRRSPGRRRRRARRGRPAVTPGSSTVSSTPATRSASTSQMSLQLGRTRQAQLLGDLGAAAAPVGVDHRRARRAAATLLRPSRPAASAAARRFTARPSRGRRPRSGW